MLLYVVGRLIWAFMLYLDFFYMTGKQCMFTKKKEKVSRSLTLTLLNVYLSLDLGPVNTSLGDHEQGFD